MLMHILMAYKCNKKWYRHKYHSIDRMSSATL